MDGLKDSHRTAIVDVIRSNDRVERAVLFGSRALETFSSASDVDIALFGDDLTISDQANMAEAMEELTIPQRVDLVLYDRVNQQALREQIQKHGIELYNSQNETLNRHLTGFEKRLQDVCWKIGSGATPRGGSKVYMKFGDVAFIRSQNIYNDRFDRKGLTFISQQHSEQLKNVEVFENDVLLNLTGDSVARVFQVPSDVLPARVNQHVAIIRPDPEKLDPKFLHYYLASPTTQSTLITLASAGATRKALTKRMIEMLEVPKMSVANQRAVSHVLSPIDDKIELNRRMNETLESIAQAIFKDWFVDFGPTRAKMEGRAPYLPAELWCLFPNTCDETGRPDGWHSQVLSQLAVHHRVTVAPSVQPEEIFEHYSIPAYDTSRTPVLDLGISIRSNKTLVPDNAVLLSKLNPDINRVWLPNPHRRATSIASTEFLVFTPRVPHTQGTLYCLFKSESFRTLMKARVTGTSKSHQRVSIKSLLPCAVLEGHPTVFAAFNEQIEPMLARSFAIRQESAELQQTRELLLPKLITGQIRIPDAEKNVEEVV